MFGYISTSIGTLDLEIVHASRTSPLLLSFLIIFHGFFSTIWFYVDNFVCIIVSYMRVFFFDSLHDKIWIR
jgi:hypothetical protein